MNQVVSDTGPIISLENLKDGFPFARRLFDQILIPESVLQELADGLGISKQKYLETFGVTDLFLPINVEMKETDVNPSLAPAETEAIALAVRRGLPLLIEETFGRKIAKQQGLLISGVAGLVIKAKRSGLIDEAEATQKLAQLYAGGRINKKIYSELTNLIKNSAP